MAVGVAARRTGSQEPRCMTLDATPPTDETTDLLARLEVVTRRRADDEVLNIVRSSRELEERRHALPVVAAAVRAAAAQVAEVIRIARRDPALDDLVAFVD